MTAFWIWISIIIIATLVYNGLMWKRRIQTGRFRIKLNLIFFMLIVIPNIPLTFLSADLLTGSSQTLMPDINKTFDQNLILLKTHAEMRGNEFLSLHPDTEQWDAALLSKHQIVLALLLDQSGKPIFQYKNDTLTVSVDDAIRAVQNQRNPKNSCIILDVCQCALYTKQSEQHRIVLVYPVEKEFLQNRHHLLRVMDQYNTIGLLRDSMFRHRIIWSLAVVWMVLLSVIAFWIAGYISGRITRPVEAMVKGMQEVGSGNLQVSVNIESQDEFGYLNQSFNHMILELDDTRARLLQAERIAAWQKAARRMSHEIKNALTPIAISLTRLKNHLPDSGSGPVRDSLNTLQIECGSLKQMAGYFSEFAHLPQPDKQPLQINDLLEDVMKMMRETTPMLEFQMELTPDLPSFSGDPEQLRRVFINLIKNSIEASDDHPVITIQTAWTDAPKPVVCILITDQGEGMDAETLESLFTPYHTTKPNGTGLGMTIVQKIIHDHSGQIEVTSRKGQGTQVNIKLPV